MENYSPVRPEAALLKDSESLSTFQNIFCFWEPHKPFVVLFHIIQQNKKTISGLKITDLSITGSI